MALLLLVLIDASLAESQTASVTGTVLDPSGRMVAGATIHLTAPKTPPETVATGPDGRFTLTVPHPGVFTIRVEVSGYEPLTRTLTLPTAIPLTLRIERVLGPSEQVVVTSALGERSLTEPDPSQRVMVREELLDANPGRPGAPVSLPGIPIETASGGIKAPQYFVPGVAGDHGEPIAQYIQVGSYLAPNNLSANAHGNGYADPNIFIPATLGSVSTDGGAFNVLEGNHSLNLAAVYSLRPQLSRFLTVTGDYRDVDVTGGIAPSDPARREWIALEASYGNGLLDRLEHRQQYKWNAFRVFRPARQEITLFGIGYYGISDVPGLVPLGEALVVHDTIDPRQRDQTHTAELAVNDLWKPATRNEVSVSGFFRTYNLALFSNFGEGLIRQSEFRTVEGAEVRITRRFTPAFEVMAGLNYNEDDPRRDNLDHYLSSDPRVYGPFVKVLANDLTIRDFTPYAAADGNLSAQLRWYAGLRPDSVEMKNTDLLKPADSFDLWKSFLNPKATLAWTPAQSAHWLPSAALSVGQAFFTEDPRIGVGPASSLGAMPLASPFERSHSEQLVVEKAAWQSDLRVTLGQTTTTATLAKIDPDTGLPDDLGPGILRFLTASLRHQFTFGSLQEVVSKADARLTGTPTTAPMITPEAPRTILDTLAILDRLPLGLQGRAEYEYVGHKLLDVGGFEAIPVGETRLTVVRRFMDGRLEAAVNGMVARGYTGQTTETFAPGWNRGDQPPACAPGADGVANDFDCGTVERSVGVRLPSFAGASLSWRFASGR